MRDDVTSRLRQAALFAAVLLHLVGAAVLPALHAAASAPGAASVTAVAPAGDGGAQLPPAHDEATCLFCAAAHTPALPASGAQPLPAAPRTIAAYAEAPRPEPALRGTSSLARAPPALT